MIKCFVTFFGVGLIRPASGTWGSLAGAIVGYFILKFLGASALFGISFLIFLISINIINNYEKTVQSHDNSEIVVDEAVGVWIAMSISCAFVFGKNGDILEGQFYILSIILSFIYFRAFDILKPSIIGKIDREVKGGLGVMLDDVLAGFFAGIGVLMTLGIIFKLGYTKILF